MKKIKKSPVFLIALIASVISIVYWGVFVKERYVSTANIVLQSPGIASPEMAFSSIISGASATNTADLLYLREYLLSVDVLSSLEESLQIKKHYSSSEIDFFNRLNPDDPIEFFHEYFLSKIEVTLDSYSNVLIVSSSAYSAEMAHKITSMLLQFGEAHMNKMGQRLANEQLKFIEKQVNDLAHNLEKTQKIVLDYQNKHSLISPTDSTESLFAITTELNAELIKLTAQKNALLTLMSPKSTQIKRIESNIKALENQIKDEKAKMTGAGNSALNKMSAEYNALLLKAEFAQEMYSNALATLESTRVEAARKLKQVSILQSPTLPEYPTNPNRIYNITVSLILIFMASILLGLMTAVIKDHKD